MDCLVGGVVVAIVGAILAVNLVIFAGIDSGYEASPREIFEQNWIVGVLTVAILISGPILGVVVARALRRKGGLRWGNPPPLPQFRQ